MSLYRNATLEFKKQNPHSGHSLVTYRIKVGDRCTLGSGYFVVDENNCVSQVKATILYNKDLVEFIEKHGFSFEHFKN